MIVALSERLERGLCGEPLFGGFGKHEGTFTLDAAHRQFKIKASFQLGLGASVFESAPELSRMRTPLNVNSYHQTFPRLYNIVLVQTEFRKAQTSG